MLCRKRRVVLHNVDSQWKGTAAAQQLLSGNIIYRGG